MYGGYRLIDGMMKAIKEDGMKTNAMTYYDCSYDDDIMMMIDMSDVH